MTTEVVRLEEAERLTGISRWKIERLIDEGVITSFNIRMRVGDWYSTTVKVIAEDQLDVLIRWKKSGEIMQNAKSLHKISRMTTSDFLDEREEALYDEIEFINGMRNYLEKYGF